MPSKIADDRMQSALTPIQGSSTSQRIQMYGFPVLDECCPSTLNPPKPPPQNPKSPPQTAASPQLRLQVSRVLQSQFFELALGLVIVAPRPWFRVQGASELGGAEFCGPGHLKP